VEEISVELSLVPSLIRPHQDSVSLALALRERTLVDTTIGIRNFAVAVLAAIVEISFIRVAIRFYRPPTTMLPVLTPLPRINSPITRAQLAIPLRPVVFPHPTVNVTILHD